MPTILHRVTSPSGGTCAVTPYPSARQLVLLRPVSRAHAPESCPSPSCTLWSASCCTRAPPISERIDAPHGVVQQARQLAWRIADGELRPRFLLRDRDAKFTRAFDGVFGGEGVEVIRLPVRSPVANSFAERWVVTARRECLDHLLI